MPWGFEQFLWVTTDKLTAYEQAIAQCFRHVRYAYLQIVKQRRKRRLVTVKQRLVKGKESDFPPKTRNTSYLERFNLTLRQRVSYLQRKTLGYCKSQVISSFDSGDEDGINDNSIRLASSDYRSNSRKRP